MPCLKYVLYSPNVKTRMLSKEAPNITSFTSSVSTYFDKGIGGLGAPPARLTNVPLRSRVVPNLDVVRHVAYAAAPEFDMSVLAYVIRSSQTPQKVFFIPEIKSPSSLRFCAAKTSGGG